MKKIKIFLLLFIILLNMSNATENGQNIKSYITQPILNAKLYSPYSGQYPSFQSLTFIISVDNEYTKPIIK